MLGSEGESSFGAVNTRVPVNTLSGGLGVKHNLNMITIPSKSKFLCRGSCFLLLLVLWILADSSLVVSGEPAEVSGSTGGASLVTVTLHAGEPATEPASVAAVSHANELLRFETQRFLLTRIPHRYDAWGIRDAWQAPLLLRLEANVALPPGTHRLLAWVRGASRLTVDGSLVMETQALARKQRDGEEPIAPLAQPPQPGLRARDYGQQEIIQEIQVGSNLADALTVCHFVWQVTLGGQGQRTETGEICLAIELEGGDGFQVLAPDASSRLPLTDQAVEAANAEFESSLNRLEAQVRRQLAASMDEYWQRRHAFARHWAQQNLATHFNDLQSRDAVNRVDLLLQEKFKRQNSLELVAGHEGGELFQKEVLPILREHCWRCHAEKRQGGLQLDSRHAVLQSGESGMPAVVPGDPQASYLMQQIISGDMPPGESQLSETQAALIEQWIREGAEWSASTSVEWRAGEGQSQQAPIIDDASFLRRVYLDTIGVPPSFAEIQEFLHDKSPNKRQELIEELLNDERLADNWMSFWQDLLAENPTLLNQSMGSTGPFRWFLFEALVDRKPLDRMVTELVWMRGDPHTGGSAGFASSGESDMPLADKAHILASAFLGVELQCARCHDSPYHETTQRDLYALAAMLKRDAVKIPSTSRVPPAFFEKQGRQSLIEVTLEPDAEIEPVWPFIGISDIADRQLLESWMLNPPDTRERLAVLLTAPQNSRFSQVIVNRLWKRFMGAGLVEPVDDWEGQTASHPRLLKWLSYRLLDNDYDLRVVMGDILSSRAYQSQAVGHNLAVPSSERFFSAPDRRRMTAEQVVDSLHVAMGSPIACEELTFVHDGQRELGKRQTLGIPKRAWMFTNLNNERDRPSLSLPQARAVTDVLEAFGWNGSRQHPISERDADPHLLQPAILANGVLVANLTRASQGSDVAQQAIDANSPQELVLHWYWRILGRKPDSAELEKFTAALADGFESRIVAPDQLQYAEPLPRLPLVTWFNHLQPETTTIQQEQERRVQAGPPPDPRLETGWRSVYEDFLWSLINHHEFVWIP
ncbi:MAG: PSD1 and planctomycete cytochrome C domain-containing protein [bacterium]|nr:PSD1 and planctomycete cytochrome C domain-containing protein [bacterium]